MKKIPVKKKADPDGRQVFPLHQDNGVSRLPDVSFETIKAIRPNCFPEPMRQEQTLSGSKSNGDALARLSVLP